MQQLHQQKTIQPLQIKLLLSEHSKQQNQKLVNILQRIKSFIAFMNQHQKVQEHLKVAKAQKQEVIKNLHQIFSYFHKLVQDLKQNLVFLRTVQYLIDTIHSYLIQENFNQLNSKQKTVFVLQFQTKFLCCLQFFHSLNQNISNITNSQKDFYKEVWDDIKIQNLGQAQEMSAKYKFLKKMMIITTTAIITEQQMDWSLSKKMCFGLSYPRYMIDYDTARLKSFLFYRTPNVNLAQTIWNIPQLGASKQMIKIAFQSIPFNQKIYIPINESETLPNIHKQSSNSIQVRVLNYKKLELKTKQTTKSCFMCCSTQQEYNEINSIIIHMHGGGFIALSSRMMQTMTRRWAKKLKIPIFSIDYRKPPNFPFPAAPNDCLTVYKFIVNHIHKYMNIYPKNIYLAGDSAGGNLACSLMGQILRNNLPIPKGIYVAYPAADLRMNFSPSKVNAINDPLLWPSMLILCLKEYLGGNLQSQFDPKASPVLLTQAYVGGDKQDQRFPLKWPKTFISVGMKDPLYDDSLLLMQKMKQSGIECHCRAYKNFSHGFLSTDFLISQSEEALKHSILDLKKLIGISIMKKK